MLDVDTLNVPNALIKEFSTVYKNIQENTQCQ